jgi:hypothetical protein
MITGTEMADFQSGWPDFIYSVFSLFVRFVDLTHEQFERLKLT